MTDDGSKQFVITVWFLLYKFSCAEGHGSGSKFPESFVVCG